ncbi:hypothetical protein [Halococcus saccharolyticus]|uniref:DUF7973 domain-containing protein n=1 Tax=Halococcus saccharolyticus DSM 5350 TaxID=1227455 RepID=M0ME42_9EURY|nr:hypothetical protein [Halococcus saccharolyticus]EMA43996.1 hypothetical protein C449_10728 [Halococcus saccharolyticus DSM 5350]
MEHLLLQIPVIGVEVEQFVVLLIAALAGGAFGAALGALPAFIFTGFAVFLGEGLAILEGNLASAGGIEGDIATGVTGTIGFGMVFGPHIAFAGGVAATAYAGKKYPEMNPAGWDYHFGKDILYAFGTKPDILAVGAVFGAVGMLINQLAAGIGFPTDGIALSVFLTAMLARVVFDYPLIGPRSGSSIFDMSPFEREEERAVADGGTEVRLATEPWLPHQYQWSGVAVIGLVAGLLGGFIYIETGSIFLGYAFSAMSLLFLNLGVEKIPVTHHITLLGSVGAVIATAMGTGPVVALLAAGVFGTISGLFGEVTQRIFYSHSGTHVDPPAMAIALSMFIVGVLFLLGVIPSSGYLGL